MSDHVYMVVSMPRKYSESQVMGYIEGKSAIQLAVAGIIATYFHSST